MKNSAQHRSWTHKVGSRPAIAALTMAVLIAFTLIAIPSAQAQTFTIIHNFSGQGEDGANPYGGLVMDRAGNLYGTTEYGGSGPCSTQHTRGCGTVYKMKPFSSGWSYTPLYSFAGWTNNDGAYPAYSDLIIGSDGSLYGTTTRGGEPESCDGNPGCGTVFNLKPSPTRPRTALSPWSETVLYRFLTQGDGAIPEGNLAFDSAGNLYGTTVEGGTDNWGVAFELSPSGGQWTYNLIHNFVGNQCDLSTTTTPTCEDGIYPYGGVYIDSVGNVDGTAWAGGSDNYGMVFQLAQSGSGWTQNNLHNFGSVNDGTKPTTTLIADSLGNLYGTTTSGLGMGDAVVFELSPSNGGWTYSILYTFNGDNTDGPGAPLTMDAAGNLYGTTQGEAGPYGTVFELSPSNGRWVYTLLHQFTHGSDGGNPYSNVVMDAQGNLYGTASSGGSSPYCAGGCGVVWKITP